MDDTTQARLRVCDADRDAVLTELGEHFQAGRLDRDEFDERTGHALGARVRGDLDVLLRDLPRPAAAPPAAARRLPPAARTLAPVLVAAVLLTAVLTAGALGAGWRHGWGAGAGFWPVWWVMPFLAARLLWWGRRAEGARPWR